jgi:hypothetical protein
MAAFHEATSVSSATPPNPVTASTSDAAPATPSCDKDDQPVAEIHVPLVLDAPAVAEPATSAEA